MSRSSSRPAFSSRRHSVRIRIAAEAGKLLAGCREQRPAHDIIERSPQSGRSPHRARCSSRSSHSTSGQGRHPSGNPRIPLPAISVRFRRDFTPEFQSILPRARTQCPRTINEPHPEGATNGPRRGSAPGGSPRTDAHSSPAPPQQSAPPASPAQPFLRAAPATTLKFVPYADLALLDPNVSAFSPATTA